MTMRPLREHQASAMVMLRQSLAGGKRAPMLQAPTGAGKTRLAAEIVVGALSKSKRVLIVVPALSLVDQTVSALEDEGISDIGVMQGMHERTDSVARVQVASVQTLQRRKMPPCDVIMIDEAHRWFQFFEPMIINAKADRVPVIGLSATPWTKGLGKHFDDLLQVTSTRNLIEAGYLSRFRVFAPSHPDLSDVRTIAGDYHEGDLSTAMDKPDLVADIVMTWLQLGEDRPTLCFGVDRAHAKNLQQQFERAGIATGYIDAFTDREERARIRHQFHSGAITVVCNVACLTTGVDWDVRCIILARPTKSEMLFVQIIGRGLRTAEGKSDCLILDHSDTHLRLGFVTDIQHDSLCTGKKSVSEDRPPEPKPKECSKCHFVRAPKVLACPSCGFKPEVHSDVIVEDGELVEFGTVAAKRKEASSAEKSAFYAQLLMVSKRKGYSQGWASNQFREKFKVWPNHYKNVEPAEPMPEVLNWIKSRQIAYAKRRKTA